jgi:hypothetical protein
MWAQFFQQLFGECFKDEQVKKNLINLKRSTLCFIHLSKCFIFLTCTNRGGEVSVFIFSKKEKQPRHL